MPGIPFVKDGIVTSSPYAFATTENAKTAAAFVTIKNISEKDDKLISANSDIAEFTEIHQNLIDHDDGTMMMRKIPALNIPENGKAILKPTGYHVMFIKLKEPLTIGLDTSLTLTFENMGDLDITIPVIQPGTKP